jgi:HPt (histidine-containing phosphotransfer) domain-containing protein
VTPDDTLDPAALRYLLEVTGGDVAFVDELVDTFLDDAVAQLGAMRAAAAADDVEALVRPAHSLKSNAANVGATRLSELCRGLEADARALAVADGAARVRAVDDEFAAVREALLAERASR